ncbi:MAG: hypothetical protein JW746_10075 [Candidatus Krumholzibacteriota bacterium]|nr:hypothetical protein [Candidatus Krumholzibacteriota bacterium]
MFSKANRMLDKVNPVMILAASLLFPLFSSHLLAGPDDLDGRLLPADDDIEGWVKDGETLSYEADDLWEYINGSAERFLEYDFERVLAQHYLDPAGEEIKVEIYAHRSPLEAFGIYSRFRSPDSEAYDIGNEAFGDGYTIHFWKGRFYVRVSAYEENYGLITVFARLIAEKIDESGSVPREVGLFDLGGPAGSKSISYVSKGVLGSGALPPAFVAEYDIEGDPGRIFLFSLKDAEGSSRILDWFRETGSKFQMTEGDRPGAVRAEGELPYRGRVIFFSYGRMTGIITGFKNNPEAADDLGIRMLDKVITFAEGKDS